MKRPHVGDLVTFYFGTLNPFTGIIAKVSEPTTRTHDYFPAFTIEMMEIGEETGNTLVFDIHEDDRLDIISAYGNS